MFLAFFHCVTIVISIIVIFCIIFFSNVYQIKCFGRFFFQLPMRQLCQAQKVHLLFVPTHHQPHRHLLSPDSQNLINLIEDKQFLDAEHSSHTLFKHFARTIVLLAVFTSPRSCRYPHFLVWLKHNYLKFSGAFYSFVFFKPFNFIFFIFKPFNFLFFI